MKFFEFGELKVFANLKIKFAKKVNSKKVNKFKKMFMYLKSVHDFTKLFLISKNVHKFQKICLALLPSPVA